MIVVPHFDKLRIENYGLFPGRNGDNTVEIDFHSDLTVIAGINGLGKTTLVTLLLRLISGPFDLTSSGAPARYETILPVAPKRLRSEVVDFFGQRVADAARDAHAELTLTFGEEKFLIRRHMANLALLKFNSPRLTQQNIEDDTSEDLYQSAMAECFNVSSFVDVLLMLHNLIFLTDRRAGSLWDTNAQRHVLSSIVLDKSLSHQFVESSRHVQIADSQYRNTRAQLGKYQRQLNDLAVKEEATPHVRAELEATAVAIEGSQDSLESLESRFSEINERYRSKRLELEKAKLESESAYGLVERAKYSLLLHSFPKMDTAARLLLSRILSEAECLVCGADAEGKKAELEALLLDGCCPACGADQEHQTNHADPNEFEHVKMSTARRKAEKAAKELEKAHLSFEKASSERSKLLHQVLEARDELTRLKSSQEALSARLPPNSKRVNALRQMVEGFEITLNAERTTLAEASAKYMKLLQTVAKRISESSAKLSDEFTSYIDMLISENARLVIHVIKARLGQESTSMFDFPVFAAEMTAADRPGLTPRQSEDDVSESQRELIDLAFRLALLEVATIDGSATFVMETPEASLDGLAMRRVGNTLRAFSKSKNKRLVITNNLTNAGMVTSVFGGPTTSEREKKRRFRSVFNLLEEAAPNQALVDNRKEYVQLLKAAVIGEKR